MGSLCRRKWKKNIPLLAVSVMFIEGTVPFQQWV